MISVGNFEFPKRSTIMQVNTIEAKSKVRKEIRIQSMIDKSMEMLENAVETFDQGETHLSLHPGRYYLGRRRSFRSASNLRGSRAWVEFTALTSDRYERSLSLHTHSLSGFFGRAALSLFNVGNWMAPLHISIKAIHAIQQVEICIGNRNYALDESIDKDQTLIIDSESRSLYKDEQNLARSMDDFPSLEVGTNQVTVQTQPSNAEFFCTIQYRDFWI